jgi:chromosome segregation ATPase
LASTASFIEDFKEFHGEHSIVLRKLGLGVHFVSGVNLVDKRLGSNGAGKSSIWDASMLVLIRAHGLRLMGHRSSDLG